jgi:hypothetical protein
MNRGVPGAAAVILALLAPVVAVVPRAALADSAGGAGDSAGDTKRADALFDSAKRIRDAGQFDDACPLFAESSRLAPGVGVLLYLGECNQRIGRTASAWTAFESAERLARARADRRVEIAHARAAALVPIVSGLTIGVSAAVAAENPDVLLDGVRIPPDEWNAAMAVDPGDHTVTVSVPGHASRTMAAHVDVACRDATVTVAAPVAESPSRPAPPSAAAATDEPPAARGAWDGRPWIGVGLLGAGALGVAVGTTILLNRDRTSSSSGSSPTQDTGSAIASGVAFALGGAALIAGVALTVTPPGTTGVALLAAPVVTARGGGAVVRATF